jgi:alanyl-tRNA synthetase
MHHFKSKFTDLNYQNTFSNIQSCLRLNDLNEIGDGTHYLLFHMLGLFSFRQWSLPKTIDFWMSFLEHIDLKPDYVTIHPDKYNQWKHLYSNYSVDIKEDDECIWNDGNIGGYCTEFYKDNIEIGNIVNTLDTCIDVGFGGERILMLKNLIQPSSKSLILIETIQQLINDNIQLSNNQHGYILKKLITLLIYDKGFIDHPSYHYLFNQQKDKWKFYLLNKNKPKFISKDLNWWIDTHGVNTLKTDMIEFFNL